MIYVFIIVAIITLSIVGGIKQRKKRNENYNVPLTSKRVRYFGGYTKKLSSSLYSWNEDATLNFFDDRSKEQISITKDSILNFSMVGEYHETISGGGSKGGGTSIGGALVGGVLLGGAGAILGSRKKVKAVPIRTTVNDTRKTVLKFKEDGTDKGMMLDKKIYDTLCFMCPEKKIK